MEISEKIDRRVIHELLRYDKEQRYRIHDRSELNTMEEVFDRSTLMTLYEIMNLNIIKELNGVIDSGKESRIYWGIDKEGKSIAVKIYLVTTSEFKKRILYIEGDPRFRIKGTRNIINLWARKEFKNLKRAYEYDVSVPKPLFVKNNILVMEFIGEDGIHAPTLNECYVERRHYEDLVNAVTKLYKAKLVHADLSEFNTFLHNDKIILFDFGAAVSIEHPNSEYFLTRDLTNINRFFIKRNVDVYDLDTLIEKVKR